MNGQIQVWEINTNPMLLMPKAQVKPERMERTVRMARQISEAFAAVDRPVI